MRKKLSGIFFSISLARSGGLRCSFWEEVLNAVSLDSTNEPSELCLSRVCELMRSAGRAKCKPRPVQIAMETGEHATMNQSLRVQVLKCKVELRLPTQQRNIPYVAVLWTLAEYTAPPDWTKEACTKDPRILFIGRYLAKHWYHITHSVHLDCHYGSRAPKPYMAWFLGLIPDWQSKWTLWASSRYIWPQACGSWVGSLSLLRPESQATGSTWSQLFQQETQASKGYLGVLI